MIAWIAWSGLLLFVVSLAWEGFKTYSGRLSIEEASRVQEGMEKLGKTTFIIIDVGGSLTLAVIVVITLITKKFHLLWFAPLALVVQMTTSKVFEKLRQKTSEPLKPNLQIIFAGLILMLVCGLLTFLQFWKIEDGTAWIIFRFWLIPVPAIALTGIGFLVGLFVFLWGFRRN
jgi:hypothetical protein